MKELSIKEKAELYDKALERAKNTIEVNQAVPNIVDCVKSLFPELIESEDEEIRKSITEFFKNYSERGTWKAISDVTKWIDWLERHGEQDNNEDVDILHRFSFYSYKDEPNVLYLSGLYVNEEYRNKGIGTKILKVADEVAKSLDCRVIRLKTKRGSDAERLYRTHGYNSLEIEDKDEIWLEKQGERKSLDDIAKESTKNKEAATSFLKSCGIMNANGELADEYKIEQDEQKPTKVEPKFKIGDVIEVKPMKCHDKIFIGKPNKIVDITEKCYILDDGKAYSIEELQDGWKLSEQKSTDNVKPKFKVGDTIAKKHNSDIHDFDSFTITDITGEKYWYNDRIICDISEQDEWEFYEPVRQKPIEWSEEDEKHLNRAINSLDSSKPYTDNPHKYDETISWLKSLRPKSQWKPSKEHYELEEFAKIVRDNLIGINKAVQKLFEDKYLQLTGNKMYGGFRD